MESNGGCIRTGLFSDVPSNPTLENGVVGMHMWYAYDRQPVRSLKKYDDLFADFWDTEIAIFRKFCSISVAGPEWPYGSTHRNSLVRCRICRSFVGGFWWGQQGFRVEVLSSIMYHIAAEPSIKDPASAIGVLLEMRIRCDIDADCIMYYLRRMVWYAVRDSTADDAPYARTNRYCRSQEQTGPLCAASFCLS